MQVPTSIDKRIAYLGDGNPKWRGNNAKYHARHVRVRTARGRATEHDCAACGGQAAEWAQVHDADPFDVMGYQPMCARCHRIYDRDVMPRGSRHGRSKINEQQADWIRERWIAGERQVDLAAEFGVKQAAISKIVRRATWKEVVPSESAAAGSR